MFDSAIFKLTRYLVHLECELVIFLAKPETILRKFALNSS